MALLPSHLRWRDISALMSPSKYREALDAYSGLMEEAKYRLLTMDTALGGRTELPKGAIREYCFLQLRMLCELIALGCLTAHGDLETGKLKEAYEADKIINRLELLHQDFYPYRATLDIERLSVSWHLDGFLMKKELVRLYRRCGDMLHRGSYKAMLSRGYENADIEEIRTWKKKIEDLLSCHAIFMADNRTMVIFRLNNEEGHVEWRTFEGERPV
jgi:hypothetical protein